MNLRQRRNQSVRAAWPPRGPRLLAKSRKAGNAAAFFVLCVSESRPEKSPTLREIPRLKSPLDCIFFLSIFIFLRVQFHKSHPKNKKGRRGKSRELKACDTKVQVGEKKKSETDKDVSLGCSRCSRRKCFFVFVFLVLDRG